MQYVVNPLNLNRSCGLGIYRHFTKVLKYYYPHFTEGKGKQQQAVPCPGSHSKSAMELGQSVHLIWLLTLNGILDSPDINGLCSPATVPPQL